MHAARPEGRTVWRFRGHDAQLRYMLDAFRCAERGPGARDWPAEKKSELTSPPAASAAPTAPPCGRSFEIGSLTGMTLPALQASPPGAAVRAQAPPWPPGGPTPDAAGPVVPAEAGLPAPAPTRPVPKLTVPAPPVHAADAPRPWLAPPIVTAVPPTP
eukprot:CAMPEP_0181233386 /NCGR_PEP_ID=MMETSP1096-20121128/36303_1 /TAXON_ID=156174 ORGANISM="Chrysochromulina ericina, Strain CCMP281" /NCGR_SAMPLE_ID=MMETSP1096 /ASSEMBLY_ACC=CAM_ASM_000453 /LENGTH=157 /DNA_ID=CAMNT_0023327873 /DNA_START=834 /DNA_END=1305 /DNA_ORIENTATION=+